MHKSFDQIPTRSISISKIINELPNKKNPFLAIAYPLAIQIKDRTSYSNSQNPQIAKQQLDIFTLQGDKSYVTERINSINTKTKNTSVNEDFLSQVENQNQQIFTLMEPTNSSLDAINSKTDQLKPQITQNINNRKLQQKENHILTENFNNQSDLNSQTNQNELKKPENKKKYGLIVKNLYKRTYLSRKDTFETSDSFTDQKQNSIFSIASKFITKNSTKNDLDSNYKQESDLSQNVEQQCLTQRSKKILGKIIPFFN